MRSGCAILLILRACYHQTKYHDDVYCPPINGEKRLKNLFLSILTKSLSWLYDMGIKLQK